MSRHLVSLILFFSLLLTSIVLAKEMPLWWEQAEAEAEREGYDLITLDDLQKLYDSDKDFLIVDVRPDYEFNSVPPPEISLGQTVYILVAQAHGPVGGNATAQSPEASTIDNNGAILVWTKEIFECSSFRIIQS